MTSQQEYQYEALRSNRHIRLLDIMGGAPNDKVECEMIHNVALDTMKRLDVKYNALSYRWGAPEPATHISINGADFPVGPPLLAMLQGLRPSRGGERRPVWIDAICINQKDKQEQGVQVKLMQDIYSLATHTLIWLGELDDDAELALTFISRQAALEPARERVAASLEDRWAGRTPGSDYVSLMRDRSYILIWQAVFAFCRRDYWSRVWMIQEIALSRNPTVVCGHMGVAWADFEAFLGSVFAFVAMREPGAMHFWHLTPLLEDSFPLLMDGMRHGIGSPNRDGRWLLSALQKYRSFSATDPRDKIYSLLGLVNAETRRAINVDYDATVERVFTDTFKYLLPARRRAEAQDDVVTVSRTGRRRATSPFASWLPNWNDNGRGPTMDDLSHCRFRASADLEPEYSFHEQDRVLEVKGYLVDNLKWLGSSASDFSSSSPTSSGDVLSTDLAIIAAVADSQVDVITSAFQGRPYREADFWKTLVCDSFPTSQFPKAPGEWGSMSVALLRTVAREEEIDEDKSALMASEYLIMLRKTMRGRCFAISRQGMYMMVPEDNALGDCIAVILGCDIPVVLGMREGELVLVGECYVDMLMDGEWLQDMEEEPATIPIR
ncbi:Heterokaryon incompatibility [Apiospora saccharicola]|uniref:Heterokaryon incompatibility n=1 Tax=Apiospora saccharicola TaxID=335842 RepID=A0ABR1UK20_9PEZI